MKKLIELRRERGLSRQEFASKIGCSARSVAAYETGYRKPAPRTAERIAGFFNLSIGEMWEMLYGEANGESRCG